MSLTVNSCSFTKKVAQGEIKKHQKNIQLHFSHGSISSFSRGLPISSEVKILPKGREMYRSCRGNRGRSITHTCLPTLATISSMELSIDIILANLMFKRCLFQYGRPWDKQLRENECLTISNSPRKSSKTGEQLVVVQPIWPIPKCSCLSSFKYAMIESQADSHPKMTNFVKKSEETCRSRLNWNR